MQHLQVADETKQETQMLNTRWVERLLAFHFALASSVVRSAVVHLWFPPWLSEAVCSGSGEQRWAMVSFYVHLKVGRSGETWVQEKNTQQETIAHTYTALDMTGRALSVLNPKMRRWGSNVTKDWHTANVFLCTRYQHLSLSLSKNITLDFTHPNVSADCLQVISHTCGQV